MNGDDLHRDPPAFARWLTSQAGKPAPRHGRGRRPLGWREAAERIGVTHRTVTRWRATLRDVYGIKT